MDRQLRDDFEMVESRVARDSVGNLRWLGYGHDKDEVQWEKQAGPLMISFLMERTKFLRDQGVGSN
jgi:hypothetical protein